ncbi:hypothetical protein A2U01_0058594, partial [Trifolium medium]|nr:hypothetical protein [Trifolium medium]
GTAAEVAAAEDPDPKTE